MKDNKQIAERIRKLRNKCGLTATVTGVVMGGGGYLLSSLKDDVQDKIEIVNKTDMTDAEKCDAFLASLLIMAEGCSLEAYQDDVGVWTYAIGNTKKIDGKPVQKGDTISSNAEAIDIAKHHIDNRIDYIFDYIKRDLSPEQKAAVKSFAYNCGAGIFVQDGELTELGKAVNEGKDDFVVEKMLEYNKGGGSFMTGLFSRRVVEAMLYQGFFSLEELEKCIIGGIGNVSCSKEFRELFNLKTKKIFGGRKKSKKARFKMSGTYSFDAVKDRETGRKILELCQRPIKGKISEKFANFNIGKNVYELMPEHLLVSDIRDITANNKIKNIPNLIDLCKEVQKFTQSRNG